MRRRVYTPTVSVERKRILQDAMEQMRIAREALGPEVMARLKVLVRDFDPADLMAMAGVNPAKAQHQVEDDDPSMLPGDREPVDHKKNLMTIMKFLQIKQDNKAIQLQIRTLLSEVHSEH